ncbi:unnamed protein product [Brassica rapa subsp. narinosa]
MDYPIQPSFSHIIPLIFFSFLASERFDLCSTHTPLALITTSITPFGSLVTTQQRHLRCESKRCSPFLERSSIPGDDAATDLRSNEWEVVPDIWRSSADKYGDRVAVLDPFRMVSFSSVCNVLECFYHNKLKKKAFHKDFKASLMKILCFIFYVL